ncbi:hypothetical protein GE107_14660 [Cohnella sp. CFH 77786]|nr:hypothetical protein [Cohnella sp. CFH 77786]
MPAKTGKQYLQTFRDGAWRDLLIKGVNMGVSKPGHFPGEMAITKEEYLRWFQEIGAMNANVIRIYTLHPPAFYEAFAEYNAKAKQPLYLIHGVWVDEDEMVASQDAFNQENTKEFADEIRRTVDVIHGNADLSSRPGHASGIYKSDISKYVLGWMLGVEWDPAMVDSTDHKHNGMADFSGTYFQTKNGSPFEIWLAGIMEDTVAYETERYKWQRPISFTNWVTTDLLRHPSEPNREEDMATVDPNKILEKPAFIGGYFAAYHVYPYYPEFLNYEEKYKEYVDFRGKNNSYAGYLHDLRQAHRMPVVVAEFGVPSSRGIAHRNVYGWNQGNHNETEQGMIDAGLYEDIYHEKMAGGIVFSWQDEWFKRTWNTMDYDDSERRPFWSNAQTGEQQFGLLSFDPGTEEHAMYVDGETDDWEKIGSLPVMTEKDGSLLEGADPQTGVKRVFVTSDERYVYFRLDLAQKGSPFDWAKENIMLLLDTVPNQGQHQIPGGSGITTDAGIDFAIDLKGKESSRIWVDSYYDTNYFVYGQTLNMMPKLDYPSKKSNGIFHKMDLVLNKPLTIPNVKGGNLKLPLETFETGRLRFGNGNPNSAGFDSLTDVAVNEKESIIELRIPWQLMNMRDPSTLQAIGDLWKDGISASEKIKGFKISLVSYKPDSSTLDSPGGADIQFTYPQTKNGTLDASGMYTYSWNGWDLPKYHERLKQSYGIMKDLFGSLQIQSKP